MPHGGNPDRHDDPAEGQQRHGSEKASKAASVNYDSFLKLLIAQMKNQDPTDPMKASEQIAQLATFSQVEQSIKTNTNLEALLQSNALGQADSVIGRKVTSADGQTSGVVEQVEVTSSGITAVLAGRIEDRDRAGGEDRRCHDRTSQ